MQDEEAFETLGSGAEKLNATLEDTSLLVEGFDRELGRMRSALAATGKDINTLEKGLSRGLRRAFEGVAFDGKNLSDALTTVARSLANTPRGGGFGAGHFAFCQRSSVFSGKGNAVRSGRDCQHSDRLWDARGHGVNGGSRS